MAHAAAIGEPRAQLVDHRATGLGQLAGGLFFGVPGIKVLVKTANGQDSDHAMGHQPADQGQP